MTAREQKLRATVLLIAQTFLLFEVKEQGGNNKGQEVERFLRLQGGHAGQPWCMAFAASVYELACRILGEPHAVEGNLSCGALKTQATKAGRLRLLREAQVGDFVLLEHADGAPFHVGVCAAPLDESGVITLIEGNTNDAGSAEGEGVFKKQRRAANIRMVAVSITP
jgi:hypothetical protein